MRALLALVLVACATVVAACGGSSRLSRDDFAAKANGVCRKYNDELRSLPQPRSASEFADFVHKGKSLVKQEIGELRRLKPPSDLQPSFDRMLAAADRGLPILDRMETAARGGDLKKAQDLDQQLSAADQQANATARRLGLATCAARA